jgi:hypothetical protein
MNWFKSLQRQFSGGAKAAHPKDVEALIAEVERLQSEIEAARADGFRAGQAAGFALARACVEKARISVNEVIESKTTAHLAKLRAVTTLAGIKAAEDAISAEYAARYSPKADA